MVSMELSAIFQKAVAFARHHRHEYVTIEHVMLALLNSAEGEAIIKTCGAEVEVIRESLASYLLQTMEPLPKVPNKTLLKRWLWHASSIGCCNMFEVPKKNRPMWGI
jgi:ATP-dependent Clp protease ATP-binding subunit ClpA